jgi:hypothetical protein
MKSLARYTPLLTSLTLNLSFLPLTVLAATWTHQYYAGAQTSVIFVQSKADHLGIPYSPPPAHHPTMKVGDFHTNSDLGGSEFGLQSGVRFTRNTAWLPSFSLGLDAAHTINSIHVSGVYVQALLEPANQYRFNYDVNIATIGPTVSFDLYQKAHSVVFLGSGVGLDAITSQHFSTTPLGDSDVTQFIFTGGSHDNLYYKVSLGYRYLMPHGSLSMAYQYQHLGVTYTGPGKGWAGYGSPGFSDALHSNGIVFACNYSF